MMGKAREHSRHSHPHTARLLPSMDIVPRADLPGAHFGFGDVRSVFEDAAAGKSLPVKVRFALISASDMNDDQMLLMDGFSLQDAMAAFEVIMCLQLKQYNPH